MPVTFAVDPTKQPSSTENTNAGSLETYLKPEIQKSGGRIVKVSSSSESYVTSRVRNGFVSACLTAYNEHLHLEVSPDDVWISITTSFARYINANAKKMRHAFVDHEGKITLTASGGGSLETANYDNLISQISDQIDAHTKGGIRAWMECDFTTTTPLRKVVSKVVLMGAMKDFFSYKMHLLCGLPQVTLTGTVDDWKSIRSRVDKLREYEGCAGWSEILGSVLDHFVNAFADKVDVDFWNRIAHITGGGSGPRYLEGWILSLIAFDEKGNYFLHSLKEIQSYNSYGKMNTNDIPSCTVEVPVTINDNGREYDTLFYAGSMLASRSGNTISPTLDWALVDITGAKPSQ